MPGKASLLTPLAAQKQLLLMESELNREQFLAAVQLWKNEFRRSQYQLDHFSSLASLSGNVVTALPALSRIFSRRSSGQNSGTFHRLIRGIVTGTSIWYLLRLFRAKFRTQQ